jgi:hypothetical protein
MTEKKSNRPSRWQAFLNSVRAWLCRPVVLKWIISVAKLIFRIYIRKLFGNDPWTFYCVCGDKCRAT